MDDMQRATQIAAKYRTPRYIEIERLEQYARGTQYDGRPDFFSPEADVPLLQRKPPIVPTIVANAIRSNGDFVLGEGRWPAIVAPSSDAEHQGDEMPDTEAFSHEQAECINRCVERLVARTRLRSVMRQSLARAQRERTAVLVVSMQRGRPTVTAVPAKACAVEFSPTDPREVTRLEVCYPYIERVRGPEGWMHACRLYRRVIDAERDVTYLPGEGREDGTEPAWVEDPERTVAHGLGFAPVVWYPFLREDCADSPDGEAIHERLLDEIDAYCFALSQRHRAALYAGDPQMVEIGVEEGAGPRATGHAAVIPAERGKPSYFGLTQRGAPARRKGSGTVWTYENPDAKVAMLTLPGDALAAIDGDARDLRAKIHEGMAVVDLDVENAKVAQDASGKAMEIAYRRQLDHCDVIREDFGDGCLLPTVRMLLRVAFACRARGQRVDIPLVDEARKILEPRAHWDLDLVWGPYFRPTERDAQEAVKSTVEAMNGGVITRKVAVAKLAPFFPMQADDDVLQAIGVTDGLALKSMAFGSDTASAVIDRRILRAALPGLDDETRAKIEAELDAAAAGSAEMRSALVERMTGDGEEDDSVGQDRSSNDEGAAEGGDDESAPDSAGG